MVSENKLIIACDGESASGKSTASKLISRRFNLLLINSGLIYRYVSKLLIQNKSKNTILYIKKRLKNISYNNISKQKLHSEEISNKAGIKAKNKKIRNLVNNFQKKLIKNNNRICVEGRDIASKILSKDPKYDLAFYFKCNLDIASRRRWLDIKKKVSFNKVKNSLRIRTQMDKKRKNSPLIKVKDAILIRTDKLSKKQVLDKMTKHIKKLK